MKSVNGSEGFYGGQNFLKLDWGDVVAQPVNILKIIESYTCKWADYLLYELYLNQAVFNKSQKCWINWTVESRKTLYLFKRQKLKITSKRKDSTEILVSTQEKPTRSEMI